MTETFSDYVSQNIDSVIAGNGFDKKIVVTKSFLYDTFLYLVTVFCDQKNLDKSHGCVGIFFFFFFYMHVERCFINNNNHLAFCCRRSEGK